MWTAITRPVYERGVGRYASDMTDREWALIAPFMPPRKMTGRKPDDGYAIDVAHPVPWTQVCLTRRA